MLRFADAARGRRAKPRFALRLRFYGGIWPAAAFAGFAGWFSVPRSLMLARTRPAIWQPRLLDRRLGPRAIRRAQGQKLSLICCDAAIRLKEARKIHQRKSSP